MALTRGIGARKDAVRGTTAVEVRKALAGLFTTSAVGTIGARAGVLPSASSQLVTGTSSMAYAVGPFHAVTTRGASDGSQLFSNDGAVSVGSGGVGTTVPAAPGTGLSRIDVIWVRHPAADENGDTSSQPVFGVTSGTPASLPLTPAIPAGALELARNTMSAGVTSTAAVGNVIQPTFPWLSLRDVPTRVRGSGEQGAFAGIATNAEPVRIYRQDIRQDLVDFGGGFMRVSMGALTGRAAVSVTSLVNPDSALTGIITVDALPVDYRVIVTAMGRSGGAASERQVAWTFDSHPVGATVSADGGGATSGERATAPANGFATVVTSEEILCPAGLPCTFRLMYRGSNNAINRGSLVWHREPV